LPNERTCCFLRTKTRPFACVLVLLDLRGVASA
jgi:hypothetical protein